MTRLTKAVDFTERGIINRNSIQSTTTCWIDLFSKLAASIAASSANPSVRACEITRGNSLSFYDEPLACFNAICRSIDNAKYRVWLETYSLDASPAPAIILNKLKLASQRGVDVVINVDSVGSSGIKKILRSIFRETDTTIVYFNPIWRPIGPLVYRNHRKTLICDDRAFCGSMNLDFRSFRLASSAYKRPVDYNHHLEIMGPCVDKLAAIFCQTLDQCHLPFKRDPTLKSRSQTDLQFQNCQLQVLANDGRHGVHTYHNIITEVLNRANQSLVLASSYFHPPRSLKKPLIAAIRRSVPTKLILSGLSDVPFDTGATLSTLPYFLVGEKNNFSLILQSSLGSLIAVERSLYKTSICMLKH